MAAVLYEDLLSITAVQFNDLCFFFDSLHFTFSVQREAIIRVQVSATTATRQSSPWHRFTSWCCTVWGKNFSCSERKKLRSILFGYFLFGLANRKYIDILCAVSLVQNKQFLLNCLQKSHLVTPFVAVCQYNNMMLRALVWLWCIHTGWFKRNLRDFGKW